MSNIWLKINQWRDCICYSEYKNISQKYAYAVRYKDNNTAKGGYGRYTTAFRYELRNNFPESGDESLIIRWKWLGDNNTDILSDGSDDIIGKESYWSTYDGECIIKTCATGYTLSDHNTCD